MIKMKSIEKAYGNEVVLDSVNLEIEPGKFTAFIGPNGANKSTLLSTMSRLSKKDRGVLMIKDKEIETWSFDELAKELTMFKQQLYYQMKLAVGELVAFGHFPYSHERLTKKDQEKIDEAITYMGLQPFRRRMIDTPSGGQLQHVFTAMALAQDTDIVPPDEPLNNLDIRQGISVMKILRSLVDDLGKTVIIVVHDINTASQFVDEMMTLKDGKVLCSGTPHQVIMKGILDNLYDMDLILDEINDNRICIYQWKVYTVKT